jgi:hypothetical protein
MFIGQIAVNRRLIIAHVRGSRRVSDPCCDWNNESVERAIVIGE